jgi:hypothetical protein
MQQIIPGLDETGSLSYSPRTVVFPSRWRGTTVDDRIRVWDRVISKAVKLVVDFGDSLLRSLYVRRKIAQPILVGLASLDAG